MTRTDSVIAEAIELLRQALEQDTNLKTVYRKVNEAVDLLEQLQ